MGIIEISILEIRTDEDPEEFSFAMLDFQKRWLPLWWHTLRA
jgi:hypothetical protein